MTSIHQRLFGKYQAALSFTRFARHIQNWPEVWGAYRSAREIPSPLRLRNGLVLHFESADDPAQLFREIIVDAVYTPAWFYCPQAGEIIIDIGANIGFFATSLAWRQPGLRIHCFEPSSTARVKLEQNVDSNGLGACITVHPYAVFKEATAVELNVGDTSLHSSLFANRMASGTCTETVSTITLCEAFKRFDVHVVDLLKIDAEGAEFDIFETVDEATLRRVRRVVVEFHDHFRPGARTAVESTLRQHGFSRIRVAHLNSEQNNGIIYADHN